MENQEIIAQMDASQKAHKEGKYVDPYPLASPWAVALYDNCRSIKGVSGEPCDLGIFKNACAIEYYIMKQLKKGGPYNTASEIYGRFMLMTMMMVNYKSDKWILLPDGIDGGRSGKPGYYKNGVFTEKEPTVAP